MARMKRHLSAAAKPKAGAPVRKGTPEAMPLPAVWPGQTRQRIALWDEFPEEATGRYGARRNRPKAGGRGKSG